MPVEENPHNIPILSQKSYQSTPYQDASWEIVGEPPGEISFEPLEFEVIKNSGVQVDPMFADYGGLVEGSDKRWHLPENLTREAINNQAKAEGPKEPLHTFRDEELQQLIAEAEERGRSEAARQLEEANKTQMESIQGRLNAIFQDLQKQIAENLNGMEKQAVELAVNISNKIVLQTVEINPEYIIKVVNEAIALTGSAVINKVRISPEDMEFIEVVGVGREIKGIGDGWTFEADPAVKAGCVVETSAGQIDYQLDHAWERVKESILKVIR